VAIFHIDAPGLASEQRDGQVPPQSAGAAARFSCAEIPEEKG
jgi:hypothetical protein